MLVSLCSQQLRRPSDPGQSRVRGLLSLPPLPLDLSLDSRVSSLWSWRVWPGPLSGFPVPLLGALAIIGVEPGDQLPGWLWAPWAECPSDQSLGMDLNLAWLAPGLVSIKAPRGLGRPGRVWGQCHGCGKSHRHAQGSRRTPLPSVVPTRTSPLP